MTFRRAHAVLSIAALVCAQLASLNHIATTRHQRCADHGELLEPSPAPARAAATGSVTDAAAAGRHEHCVFDAVFHQAATGQATAPAATAAPAADLAAAAPTASSPPPRAAVYRFAPKTSPPALATA